MSSTLNRLRLIFWYLFFHCHLGTSESPMWKSCWKEVKKEKFKKIQLSHLFTFALCHWGTVCTKCFLHFYTVFTWCELFFFHLRKPKSTVEKGTKTISSTNELFRAFFPWKYYAHFYRRQKLCMKQLILRKKPIIFFRD